MRSIVALLPVLCFAACQSCTEPVDPGEGEGEVGVGGEGEGEGEGEGDVGEGEGEGEVGEGEGEGEVGEGEGEVEVVDGGNGFDLDSLRDGGVLDCLPTDLPELSVTGALDALALSPYTGGRREDGVKCDDVICDDGVSCCVLCGFGACAAPPPDSDGGVPECPQFTAEYACDGDEECGGNQVCCFTLSGSECRAEADCDFDIGSSLGQFFADGGFQLPDGGPPVDGGFLDGGFSDVVGVDGGFADGGFVDGGFSDPDGTPIDGGPVFGAPLDGGFVGGEALDGGPGPQPDGGSVLDAIQETLDQGVPVCRSTLFDCEILSAEICCTSDRLTSVDIGFCLPALLCAGDFLP